MNLLDLGFGPHIQRSLAALERPDLIPARVVREDRGRYHVDDGGGPRPADLLGRLRLQDPITWPAVGDWVALAPLEGGPALVHEVLPRRSAFIRGQAGRRTAPQCVAANVDTLFVTTALDGDFNPRRLERYLVLARRSQAAPVVLLTKADRSDDPKAQHDQARAVAGEAPVLRLCVPRGEGLSALAPYLERGQTLALVGSSGVGKSTLANHLLGEERMATRAVRRGDDRGRHTTRHRQLIGLPGGASLIDTPGMRELQLWGDEEDLGAGFPEIEALRERCRFRDCSHQGEPGCAMAQALARGELDPARLESFGKLQAELRHQARRRGGDHEDRRRGRKLAKMVAQVKRLKGRR